MTEYAADYAAAVLTDVEEGALKALASLGYNASIGDVHEFCEGFTQRTLTFQSVRNALMSLDGLGWVAPSPDYAPLTAMMWHATGQGRVALEGVKS